MADALTKKSKIDVNIDYIGRTLHNYKLFSQQITTPIREIISLTTNKKLKWKVVDPTKHKTTINHTTISNNNQTPHKEARGPSGNPRRT